jgi:hypothetical protein
MMVIKEVVISADFDLIGKERNPFALVSRD